jgi:hypothetical protein
MYDLIPRREGRRKELKEKWAEWKAESVMGDERGGCVCGIISSG